MIMKIIIKSWKFDDKDMEIFNKTYKINKHSINKIEEEQRHDKERSMGMIIKCSNNRQGRKNKS